jgi:hypothetical protein
MNVQRSVGCRGLSSELSLQSIAQLTTQTLVGGSPKASDTLRGQKVTPAEALAVGGGVLFGCFIVVSVIGLDSLTQGTRHTSVPSSCHDPPLECWDGFSKANGGNMCPVMYQDTYIRGDLVRKGAQVLLLVGSTPQWKNESDAVKYISYAACVPLVWYSLGQSALMLTEVLRIASSLLLFVFYCSSVACSLKLQWSACRHVLVHLDAL